MLGSGVDPASVASGPPRLLVAAMLDHDWVTGRWASVVDLVHTARGEGADVAMLVCGEQTIGLPEGWRACPSVAALSQLVAAELGKADTAAGAAATIFLTDDAPLAKRAAALGCLPVVVEPVVGPWPARGEHLSIDSAAVLVPYFERPPAALLDLLRTDAAHILARHQLASTRFSEAVAAGGRVFIFGAGTIGQQAARALSDSGMPPVGFLDNNPAAWGRAVAGLVVREPVAVDPSRDLVVVAVGLHATAIGRQLEVMGVRHSFNLSELFFVLGLEGQPERELAAELIADRLQYHALFVLLADADSRRTLDAVVRHRLTLDTGALAALCVRDFPQWFDTSVIPRRHDYVLVDGGAYDGDTIASFAATFGDRLAGVHAFEPDADLAGRAAERFKGDGRVHVHACGLSAVRGRVPFASTGATDGRLAVGSLPESVLVDVVPLDEVVREPVSLIKLDVEGEELAALQGADGHLAADAPVLAVAVYHRAVDIWEIPRHVLARNSDYRLFLRHYTEVSFETVLYAVEDPRTNSAMRWRSSSRLRS